MAGMADDLRAALGKYGTTLNRVVLLLASAGGQVGEGDRVIEAQRDQATASTHHLSLIHI